MTNDQLKEFLFAIPRYVPRKRIKQKKIKSLHTLQIPTDAKKNTPQTNFNTASIDGHTRVFFKDIEQHLIEYIDQSEIVLGCVAWLTSESILQSLAKIKAVSIIVQKEDFLRPDIFNDKSEWAQTLRRLYNQIPSHLYRGQFYPNVLGQMDMCSGSPSLEPIRCVGNFNSKKVPAFPRSHHKFIISCKIKKRDRSEELTSEITPLSVWTGSYNFTKNAGMSFENAIILDDPQIVNAYFNEYTQIAALSEPLDWDKPWSEPEWRIGT